MQFDAYEEQAFESRAVHVGVPRESGVGVGIPVHQVAAFQFDTLDAAAQEFQTGATHSYSRIQNPTLRALEARVSALEGGAATVALASGQAATFTAMLGVLRAGDHVVSTGSVFGGTAGLLNNVLPLMGVQTTLVENTPAAVRAALRENTRLVWAETIGNPAADIADIRALADLAHEHGALLGIDNTWGGVGYLCRPLEHGADLVTHSLTKWAAGHGSVLGGSVTVGAAHDLTRLPVFTDGEPNLLAQRGADALAWRLRWLGAHQLGMNLAPHAAGVIALGLETLALRLERESATALTLARALEADERVTRVSYPGLPSSAHHTLAKQYLRGGYGAVLTFEVPDPARFLSQLQLIRMAPNLGDTRTLVIHPWTTTHGRLPEAARRAAGVTPHSIRMSVGVEHPQDLLADLQRALS
ncbi:aminotransferase class I/II-fold pyridoxal phosphate-dependent enzyme [Deinococcus maricopensis]|uniref:Cysteine synthase n=1 Tax=Deinococcus maricopensis (strain DSM 21211 / LMG 22137 / NRRL B-23946 / LB-34) TaxID=709986 RepID=E8U4W6_DEIML|nr:aminotransferase class I/II-fold pyridoxal phosphate-dependent enzyme [Deinococcus maricopensis]ADV66105.1 Cysteine synthase [Deinococcus maricopensis DSM 21211]